MAAVLTHLREELTGSEICLSSDFHRADVHLDSEGALSVRVTAPKINAPGSSPTIRFKSPSEPQEFIRYYYCGLARNGAVVVHKRTPTEVKRFRTLTFPCGI